MANLRIKPAFKFSLLVFSPLLLAFLIPSACLVPSAALLFLIGIFDPATSLTDSASYLAWVYAPVLAAAILFLVGTGLHALHRRGMLRKAFWAAVWAVFTIALFLAAWFGIFLLGSIGASDKPIDQYLKYTALTAAIFTLLCQPGVGLWLYFAGRNLQKQNLAGL
jgi:hypothetical protein